MTNFLSLNSNKIVNIALIEQIEIVNLMITHLEAKSLKVIVKLSNNTEHVAYFSTEENASNYFNTLKNSLGILLL